MASISSVPLMATMRSPARISRASPPPWRFQASTAPPGRTATTVRQLSSGSTSRPRGTLSARRSVSVKVARCAMAAARAAAACAGSTGVGVAPVAAKREASCVGAGGGAGPAGLEGRWRGAEVDGEGVAFGGVDPGGVERPSVEGEAPAPAVVAGEVACWPGGVDFWAAMASAPFCGGPSASSSWSPAAERGEQGMSGVTAAGALSKTMSSPAGLSGSSPAPAAGGGSNVEEAAGGSNVEEAAGAWRYGVGS
mmetsp:Transcript_113066/g.315951  ORF Transcript_113066/g.315951 Transcript_113066/m.315951 type:complete len:252 (-) Transcript_113066:585-1340(-)